MKRACLLVGMTLAIGCNRGPATTGTTGKPTVALVLKTLNHPFFVDMRRGAQEAADRLGVTLQVQAAEREIDVEKQMQIVENLIQTGVQALCITPSGSREIVSALVKAKDAGVPIIVVDTRVDAKAAADAGVRTETFVGSDNYEGGKLAGDYLVKAAGGKARVGISVGASIYGVDGETLDQLLVAADQAMYRAKSTHKTGLLTAANIKSNPAKSPTNSPAAGRLVTRAIN